MILCCLIISLQIENKAGISEALLTYDALQKRKPFLDHMMEGLGDFGIVNAMQLFPEVFEPLFVRKSKCEPQDVISILQPTKAMTDREQVVYQYLQRFIMECNEEGEYLKSQSHSPFHQGFLNTKYRLSTLKLGVYRPINYKKNHYWFTAHFMNSMTPQVQQPHKLYYLSQLLLFHQLDDNIRGRLISTHKNPEVVLV